MTNANADHEAWLHHERCLAMEDTVSNLPRCVAADPGPSIVLGGEYTLAQLEAIKASLYSKNVNAAESLAVLGSLLANVESRLRSFTDGTEEEQLVYAKRYSEVTREPSIKAAEAIAAFKRQVFVESEKYKEKLNG